MTIVNGRTGVESTEVEARDARQRTRYLELVAEGVPFTMAAHEVGWSWYRAKREMEDPQFGDLCALAADRSIDEVEYAVLKAAKAGNMTAAQMVLYNKRSDRWRDTRHIEVQTTTQVTVAVIDAAKQGAIELLQAHGVKAMQQLAAAVETTAVEVAAGD